MRVDTPHEHAEVVDAQGMGNILGLTDVTILKLARDGHIPRIKLNARLVRFHVPTVIEALKGVDVDIDA
jgi:hypothetical protein